jgi:hypothetical protein
MEHSRPLRTSSTKRRYSSTSVNNPRMTRPNPKQMRNGRTRRKRRKKRRKRKRRSKNRRLNLI